MNNSYWITLENDQYKAKMHIKHSGTGIELPCGLVYLLKNHEGSAKNIFSLKELEEYGFQYPDYVADIEDEIRKQDAEESSL